MPTSDGRVGHRDLCTSAVVERTIGPASVSSLKIAASLQSDNFSSGSAGWKIERDTGSAEFQDVVVRGTLNGADLIANTVTTAKLEVTASLIAGQTVESTTYTPGSAGWQIDADGSAEFDNVIVRGTIQASSIEGNVTLGTSGVFRTATSGNRIELTAAEDDRINLYTGDSFENNPGKLIGVTTGSGATRTLDTQIVGPSTTGDIGSTAIILRSESNNDSSTPPGVLFVHTGGSSQTPEFRLQNSMIMLNSNGSAAAPSFSFVGDTDTGMYRFAADELGFSVGGNFAGKIDNTESWQLGRAVTGNADIQDSAGSATFPTYSFQGDTDTGMYRSGADLLSFAAAGTEQFRTIGNRPIGSAVWPTTTGTPNVILVLESGYYNIFRDTSSRRYKTKIKDAPFLADVKLRPIIFCNLDDPDTLRAGLIAEEVADELPLAAVYNEDGEVENYDIKAVLAVMAAKLNKLNERVTVLEVAA